MRIGLKVCAWIFGGAIWFYAFFKVLWFYNQPADISLFLGLFLHLCLIVIAVGAITWGVKRMLKTKEESVKQVAKILVLFILAGFLVMNTACTRVGPGHVGIKVSYAGSDRGVNDFPAKTGWVFYTPGFSTVFEYPTYVQTAVWTKSSAEGSPTNEEISFNSKEGLIITGDISLSYQLVAEKVPAFYVKFRNDDLNGFTHGYLRNVARDIFNEVASKYTVEEIYGPKKDEFLQQVRDKLNEQLKDIGVSIQQFGFIGAPRPPQNVIDAINSKIAATQNAMRAENELRQAEAEAKKAIAKAEGEAKANQILTSSLTQQLIEWRKLELTQKAIDKWDGKRPQVEGSGSGLLIEIQPNK